MDSVSYFKEREKEDTKMGRGHVGGLEGVEGGANMLKINLYVGETVKE